jgi:hypothetical protein
MRDISLWWRLITWSIDFIDATAVECSDDPCLDVVCESRERR